MARLRDWVEFFAHEAVVLVAGGLAMQASRQTIGRPEARPPSTDEELALGIVAVTIVGAGGVAIARRAVRGAVGRRPRRTATPGKVSKRRF